MPVSKWSKFAKHTQDESRGESKPHLTMSLRQVVKMNGSIQIEQLIEHRTPQGMVVQTEWVAIPVIIEG